jgi:hypothetical protein
MINRFSLILFTLLFFINSYIFTAYSKEVKISKGSSYYLSENESNIMEKSIILMKALEKNLIQDQRYINEDITLNFRIFLSKNGELKKYHLTNVFCPTEKENIIECFVFLDNMKKTIEKIFPLEELTKEVLPYYREEIYLDFNTKKANQIFEKIKQTNNQ